MENTINKKFIRNIYILNISICAFIILYGITVGISGNDFWWHLKTGEWIYNNKAIPHTDVFSWYASTNNYTWYAHEWLSDILYYAIYSLFGFLGISVFATVILSFCHLLLMKLTQKKWERYPNFAIIWFLYEIALFTFIIQCRPYIFSFIYLILELFLLTNFVEKDNDKKIFFLPIIGMLWANMHGGSSNLSYCLPILFLLIGAIENFDFYKLKHTSIGKEKVKKLSIVSILTILGNLINPYGIEMLIYPYRYMVGGNYDMQMIGEWQPLDLKTDTGFVIVICLVITAIIFMMTEKKFEFIDFLLFGAFTYLLLQSIRFVFLFFIVATFIIFKYIPGKFNDILKEKIMKPLTLITSIGINCFIIFILIFGENYKPIETQLPNELIEIIRNSDNKRLYNYYNYGEELIWNDIPVFIDSRADVYSLNGTTLREAFSMTSLKPFYIESEEYNPDDVFNIDYYFNDKYDFDAVLLPAREPLNVYIEQRKDFKQIYNKDGIIYWEKEKSGTD